ncbi:MULTISPECIES: hypothetical protein [Clostridium]|uniref:Uncharacterized protein n=1 Tax=Clostridium butyricum TaxID=1492 RepID=A0A6N3GEJ2_CLOBU|nr:MULTISPECIES: hypothetical protein [Clostridium]KJZ86617.1 hypothetical protein ClosIBUN125C_CONTIG40g02362 [Clostridium sp. IBUN125C]KJZ89733.1 hypothetical protein ClosIBUN62F_CONTIG57g02157 [Clostridium sp. IBUN62F]KJZ96348.1 hypothetical protein ClosIBUN22A_CONTIG116g02409 [Clostridium sp. IBUN22A]KJZ97091.1 hypothetical protein ClosIBUN13A_CONTIG141g02104 [Clostridium sp. IBUN13A]KQB79190.1 hypothetical protein AK964_02710 [Clostridium butyricum]
MAYDNQELFKYIEKRAKYNVENKKFFRNTDILRAAFGVSEDKAYEIIKDMMASGKVVPNTKESLIDEYMNMLGNGYMTLSEQYSLIGGDKLSLIKKEAERRKEKFNKGTICDMLQIVFNVDNKDLEDIIIKYLKTVESTDFSFKFTEESFYEFLEKDMNELDKQADRFRI